MQLKKQIFETFCTKQFNMWAGVPVNAFALIFSAVALGIPYWAEYEHKSIGLKINYGLFQVCSDYIGCELTGKYVL